MQAFPELVKLACGPLKGEDENQSFQVIPCDQTVQSHQKEEEKLKWREVARSCLKIHANETHPLLPGNQARRSSGPAAELHSGKEEAEALRERAGLLASGLMAEQQGGEPECTVCCNPFDNTFHTPKVLDCGHSFCVECLAHLSLVTPAQRQLLCPLCRQPTVLASGQPVTDLPTDTAKLTLLHLEPHHVILEGHQLFLEDQPKSCSFLHQLQVYTLDVGPEPRSQTEDPQAMAPEPRSQTEDPQAMAPTTTPQANPIPTCYSPREYLQYPELPEAYLKAAILSITLLFIVCIIWVIQFCGV